ncbi:MAG TPA: type II secretion system protein [Candidatus Saccharimonas sp.]|nr:type II secretion system protein [Candidatus Saccharimonas sp.]
MERYVTKIRRQAGFALIEVLLVIAIVFLLAGIVVIAINPSKNLGDTRNAQRQADVTTILNSVYQYSLDNNGAVPSSVTTTATEVCATGAASCAGLVDLSTVTTNEKYVVSIPKDPQCSTTCATNGTGYKISKDANNHIIVTALAAENGKTISVTR